MSFIIKCTECGNEQEVTPQNVGYFVHEYGWNQYDFKVSEESTIGSFVTYDTSNETVLCKCGHRVTRQGIG